MSSNASETVRHWEQLQVSDYNTTEAFFTDVTSAIESGTELNFDNLYPVLLQTFVVIVLGYLSGRWGIIGSVEAKGLNTFVGNFALPCIIFTALAELDFSRVNWMFLLAILISKLAVFVGVLIFTLLLTRPMDFSKAGLFAIFCTQSNDFALGYPIVAAVYGNSHPEYAKYLYVMAPISLVLLNPIAFLCLEIGERRRETQRLAHMTTVHHSSSPSLPSLTDEDSNDGSTPSRKISNISSSSSLSIGGGSSSRPKRDSGCRLFLTVWKNMLFTPIVLMTVMGIAVNFLCNHEIPAILKNLCGVLSSAFSATALFALGLRMVGQMKDLGGAKLVVPGILIGVKCLVLPILTREVTIHIDTGSNNNASLDLSNLGFLLGTFPSAPGTLFYAIQYNVAADMIATAMVACTFISAPLTFVSARMVSLSSANPSDYVALLDGFLMRVAIVGLVCTLFMLTVFLASKKWKKVPHFATLCLTIAQCMGCTGVIMWYILGRDEPWKKHLQFMVFAVGVFSSRLWSALASVTLLLLRMKNLSYVLKARPFLLAIGWGVPIVLASSLCSFGTHSEYEEENPNFQFGKPQALVASSVLIISFTVTIICLVWQQRLKERPNMPTRTASVMSNMSKSSSSSWLSSPNDFLWDCQQQTQQHQIGSGNNGNGSNSNRTSTTTMTSSTNSIYHLPISRSSSQVLEAFNNYSLQHQGYNKSTALMVESLFSPCDDAPDYNVEMMMETDAQSQYSVSSRKPITRRLTEPEECGIVRDRDDEFQIMRHVTLLLALSFSMFVGIAVCVWTLVMEELTGIYVMLLFLDETLNFGQSIFVFVLFGLEPRRLLAPVWSGLRKQMKTNQGHSTKSSKKNHEQALGHTCEQFMMFYMDKCIRDLVRDRTWHLKEYTNVFCGNEMVDWLLLMGLARDRSHAEKYGQGLLDGGIICHVDGRKDFHDQPYFYSFL